MTDAVAKRSRVGGGDGGGSGEEGGETHGDGVSGLFEGFGLMDSEFVDDW